MSLDRLGHYRILDKIGSGGMGEVYRARDVALDRLVAIKVLPERLANDQAALARFEREARAVATLSHPNIVAIHQFGRDGDVAYAVTELLDGETLRERLSRAALPVPEALDFAIQILQGLTAAHEQGVVHRDLKPDNIFVTRSGVIKILDFGIAKSVLEAGDPAGAATIPDITAVGTIVGTVGYMSPEQVRGEPIDRRCDLFALGAILYEMLTGRRAFREATGIDTLSAILGAEPPAIVPLNPSVPPALERIIRRCLEKQRELRFDSARDLAFVLGELRAESCSTVQGRALPPKRPTRGIAIAIVVVVVGFAAAATYWLATRPSNASLTAPDALTYQRLTFRRGTINSARFGADGRSVIYSASWEGEAVRLYTTMPGARESRALELTGADVLHVGSNGDILALLKPGSVLGWSNNERTGMLARASLGGGAPRELLSGVRIADSTPDGTTLAIASNRSGRVRVEFPLGTVVHETGDAIQRLRVSPDATRIAFGQKPTGYGTRWTVNIIERGGNLRSFPTSLDGDYLDLVWSPKGDRLWMDSWLGAATSDLSTLSMDGRLSLLLRPPIEMHLLDVAPSGDALLTRSLRRSGIIGMPPGERQERDFSWLDASELVDVSDDGRTLLMTEYGQGGGPEWSVFLRKTDGSPAVRLGDGQGFALSPDGRFALTMRRTAPPVLIMVPTGAGESIEVNNSAIVDYRWAAWMPDGKQLIFAGSERDRDVRYYVQDPGGTPRAITPEGVLARLGQHPVSPDGSRLATRGPDGRLTIYPLTGGEPQVLANINPSLSVLRWSQDGRSIYVYEEMLPARVYRVEAATGRQELWKTIVPPDAAGLASLYSLQIVGEGAGYYYTYIRDLSDLFLVRGLR